MDFTLEPYDAATSASWLVCSACGTQYPTTDRFVVTTCDICDDPRQYVPRSGQSFTTLAEARAAGHRNELKAYPHDNRITFIRTVPRLAIGQRAILVRTPGGNILWDCITLLDEDTIARVNELGGISAIVISHPHFNGSHVQWARAFKCPVYIAAEDQKWTTTRSAHHRAAAEIETEILPGAVAIKLGGHFPGSLVLLFDGRLFIADTMMMTAAGLGKWHEDAVGVAREKPPGLNTFSFFWSIPNSIPLSADEIARMWGILRGYEFRSSHGGFDGLDIEDDRGLKGRLLESMKIQTRAMGFTTHALLDEKL